MSLHISANKGEIARIVLMPGDPLRAKHIAETMLDNPVQVNNTRNMFGFTGTYKGVRVSVCGSGMGCPSIGIYSYELYDFYNVECIIRIGTAGAYNTSLALFDLVNADKAYSESTYAINAHNFPGDNFSHQGKAFDIINEVALQINQPVKNTNIHSSDVFYRVNKSVPRIALENDCPAVEMESFALFSNARLFNKMAACLLTISDIIPTGEHMTANDREISLKAMTTLALESVLAIDQVLG